MATTAPPEDPRLLVPIAEAATLLGVSVRLLKAQAPTRRIGRKWLIPRSWLEALATWPEDA